MMRLGVAADDCVAVEDSSNGIRSAAAAGMTVVAVPNREFPPDRAALALADDVVGSIEDLQPERVRRAVANGRGARRVARPACREMGLTR